MSSRLPHALIVVLIAGCGAPAALPAPAAPPAAAVVPVPVAALPTPAAQPETSLSEVARLLTPDGSSDSWDPRRLWLTAFRDDGVRITLSCQAFDAEDISELARRLVKSPWFENVVLERASTDQVDGAEWIGATITARTASPHAPRVAHADDPPATFGTGHRNPFERRARPVESEGDVVAERVPLGSLALLAIVDGAAPRAMFVDAAQRGVIVKVGTRVGSADGGAACRWRVAAIGGSSVSLVRDVPSACAVAPPQQVLRLPQR